MVQEAVNKIIPKKNKGEKAKRLSEKALQTVEKKKSETEGRKGKIYPTERRVPESNK